MSAELIYHKLDNKHGSVSPFDAAIMGMAEGQELFIACPYLGLDYLNRIVAKADRWRLLTDIEAWLGVSKTAKERKRIKVFILANGEKVHHCKELHAKVLIVGTQALVGSANFTAKGVLKNVELGVRFQDCKQIKELREWFDQLWGMTKPVGNTELHLYVASMPTPAPLSGIVHLKSAFPGIRSTPAQLGPHNENADAEARLIQCLRCAPAVRVVRSL